MRHLLNSPDDICYAERSFSIMRRIASGQSNVTERPHHRGTWTVQLYSSGGTNVHPPSNTCFLAPTPLSIPNGISIGSAVFAQLTPECYCLCSLQWAARPPPSKLSLCIDGSGPHLIHDSLGPSKPTTQMAFRSVQPFLQGLML